MEYEMKGGASCVRAIATLIKEVGYHLSILYPLPIIPTTHSRRVILLALSKPSLSLSLSLSSLHLSTSASPSLPRPSGGPRATRVVCPVRPFAPAFLYAGERRVGS